MNNIGVMAMPADFPYRDVFLKGKPRHDRFDRFSARHPKMPAGRRAKIFAPFDALKGFSEAIAAKDALYVERKELNEEDRRELDRRLRLLKRLARNSRTARDNDVVVTVTCFVPCPDENNEAFGRRGSYCEITGVCRGIDEIGGSILIDRNRIALEDVLCIEGEDGVFREA